MKKISEIMNEYKNRISYMDAELIIAHSLDKTREFVLTHPEKAVTEKQEIVIQKNVSRRIAGEPVAYIVGHKEFYGLDFMVDKHTLIPRPETELMVEQALEEISNLAVVDIGTGSGNIITAIAKNADTKSIFYAIDISKEALRIARKNAKNCGVDKEIKFLHGSLLEPIIKSKSYKPETESLIIVANLPYLSKEIYASAMVDVKKFEPKSALYSPKAGLAHYEKLLKQIEQLVTEHNLQITAFFEISPEQKNPLGKNIKSIFPKANISFSKDLAGKWRVCKISF